MNPLIAAAVRYTGVTWVTNNVIGGSGLVGNYFNPKITTPPPTSATADFPSFSSGFYKFTCQTLSPTDNDLKALDDYFESFGYNVQTFGSVNLKVRSNFTYIKTVDAQVTASNLEAANQMCAMLNSGIKFWVGEIGV